MNRLTVEGLGKRYRLGSGPDQAGPRGLLRRLNPFARGSAAEVKQAKEFWALKDVSFAVEPGTVLGVIGPNGAGKTTLLKILASVITPTEGRVIGSGRVVSLLELGAGFDPDLSARENVFLNAAMLGISRSEAARRLDDILAFAEVEKFVDTPLKHYSSGMYLRLAFSVAISMEPSILLADEILAVGDQAFQERCLERVKQEAERGLTVLFVSHDMEAIVRVCNRTLWLNGGQIAGLGDSDEIVSEYQTSVYARGLNAGERGRHANKLAILHEVKLVADDGREVRGVQTDQAVSLLMRFELLEKNLLALAAYDVRVRSQLVFRAGSSEMRLLRKEGMYEAQMRVPANFFNEMTYGVYPTLTVARQGEGRRQYVLMTDPLSFIAYPPEATMAEKGGDKSARAAGFVAPIFKWKFDRLDSPKDGPDNPEPEETETDVTRV